MADTPSQSSEKVKVRLAPEQPATYEAADQKVWKLHWRRQLPRLTGMPLIAVGAGPERKAPASLRNGELLTGWHRTAHDHNQIETAHKRVCSAGLHTGRWAGEEQSILVFDIDGAAAVENCLASGCDPQVTRTWQTHRNTDPCRLKVKFRLTPEQAKQLGDIKSIHPLKAPIKDEAGNVLAKGEALEIFHQSNSQVIVLGEHPSSKGFYFWPEGMGPEDLAPITPEWWALVISSLEREVERPSSKASSKPSSSSTGEWANCNPCPICGRNTTNWCSERRSNGAINCRHGSTFSPVLSHGVLSEGKTITGTNGTVYGFCGSAKQKDGTEFSKFSIHDPSRKGKGHRQHQQPEHARNGEPAKPKTDPAILPANFQDLIQGLPSGWTKTENGVKPSNISVGQMALLIEGKKGELLRFNEMTMFVEVETSHGWQPVNDAAMDSGYVLLDQKGWIIGLESVIKAVCHVARQRSTHPVRKYLLKIEQDASIEPYNLYKVGLDMFRAKDPLHAAMVRKWLIGAAARVLSPGCQMDYCLVLHSREQGMLKSSALTELASAEWHTSTIPKEDKDFLLNVHSTWLYELAELESYTNKRAAGELKNTITTRTDNFRVPYGRTNERRKRPSVFCGSVNTDSFLRDETGSRRYWVVPIEGNEKLDIDAIKKNRDSIWKAAVMAYRAGELPMLSEEQEVKSERQNDGFQAQDAWLEMLQSWMSGYALARFGENDPSPRKYEDNGYYSSAEILYSAGLKRPDQINNHDATRLGPLLRELGFTSKRVTDGTSKIRRWTTRTTPDHPETVSGGPGRPTAPEALSDLVPPGPPEKVKRRQEKQEVGAQLAQGRTPRPPLETSGGPYHSAAESGSVCNRSDRTTSTSDSGGLSGGPRPISSGLASATGTPATPPNCPSWGDALLQLRADHPGQLPTQLANMLQAEHGITTDGRAVKTFLKAWDAEQASEVAA